MKLEKILVPLDGSPLAEAALAPAIELADFSGPRRILVTIGVDPAIEYVDSDFDALPLPAGDPVYRRHVQRGPLAAVVGKILEDYRVEADKVGLNLTYVSPGATGSSACRSRAGLDGAPRRAVLLTEEGTA